MHAPPTALMADFNRSQIFNGTCAPFIYIRDCPTKHREAYINASRFWLAFNSVALVVLTVSFIRRLILVKERFNTLRLAMICFGVGIPLHIVYDALRVNSPNQQGAPIHVVSFLWVIGWVPHITGAILLVVTWMSFSAKDLLARPALTGYPVLFWSIEIPYVVSSIIGAILCGVNYWYYFVSMRCLIASWAALFLILACCAGYFGSKTLSRLSKTGDNFNRKQQLRALIALIFILSCCALSLGVQSYFMTRIDEIYQVFLLCSTLYRICGATLALGSAGYAWVATSHLVTRSVGASASDISSKGNSARSPRAGYHSHDQGPSGRDAESESEENPSPEPEDESDSSVSSSSSIISSSSSSSTDSGV